MGWVLRVFSRGALSHADTLEISCHSSTRVLLPALESMESKRSTVQAIEAIQRTFTYKITEVQHLFKDSTNSNCTLSRDKVNVI